MTTTAMIHCDFAGGYSRLLSSVICRISHFDGVGHCSR